MPPTPEETAVLVEFLKQPRTQEIFRAEQIERIFNAVKNRVIGRVRHGSRAFTWEDYIPASVRDITLENLNAQLEWWYEREDWTVCKKPQARIAREEQDRQARLAAIAAEEERVPIANDPIIQAAKRQAALDAEANAEKELFQQQAQSLPGENSLQTLQRFAAFKESYMRRKFPRPERG